MTVARKYGHQKQMLRQVRREKAMLVRGRHATGWYKTLDGNAATLLTDLEHENERLHSAVDVLSEKLAAHGEVYLWNEVSEHAQFIGGSKNRSAGRSAGLPPQRQRRTKKCDGQEERMAHAKHSGKHAAAPTTNSAAQAATVLIEGSAAAIGIAGGGTVTDAAAAVGFSSSIDAGTDAGADAGADADILMTAHADDDYGFGGGDKEEALLYAAHGRHSVCNPCAMHCPVCKGSVLLPGMHSKRSDH
jgi:hypothetical protein